MSKFPPSKLVILGESSTGKTSLALRFTKNTFHSYTESTLGATFLRGTTTNPNHTFEIWDTAGQERYHSLASMYYRHAKAAIVMYDITNRVSFECAQRWIEELLSQTQNIVIRLCGNKCDLSSKREVSVEEGQALADSFSNSVKFMETSAKSGFCVVELFQSIAMEIESVQGNSEEVVSEEKSQQKIISLLTENDESQDGKQGGCC
jgi:small GTP-binding protein